MIEILAPSGDAQAFYSAINGGANAVYLGLKNFSARKSAENFSIENLKFYVDYAHFFGIKVYVALNTLVKNSELNEFNETLIAAYNSGVDAFILQDALLGRALKRLYPEITLHLSTQAGVNNIYGAKFARDCGFSRVILARETPLSEIEKITKIIETEVFVQGALCSCFSGHCYFSAFVGGNSGNRGFCKQPCRQKYTLSGNKVNRVENYAISLSDLCLADEVNTLIQCGVKSFKIEGRMRSAEYVAASVKLYKKALSCEDYNRELSAVKRTYNRNDFTVGYIKHDGKLLSKELQSHCGENIGKVAFLYNNGQLKVTTTERIEKGDAFKILRSGRETGNAVALNDGNVLEYKGLPIIGDDVNITKDISLNKSLVCEALTTKVGLKIKIDFSGVFVVVNINGKDRQYFKSLSAMPSENAPLSSEEIKLCFSKTNGLPFEILFESIEVESNLFVRKSELNAARREIFSEILVDEERKKIAINKNFAPKNCFTSDIKANKNAFIISDICNFAFNNNQVVILFPNDYNALLNEDNKNFIMTYLYVPVFVSEKDLELIFKLKDKFCGLYIDSLNLIPFAKKCGIKFIIGMGANIFNSVDMNEVEGFGAEYICLSKELSIKEATELFSEKTLFFGNGNIRLMEYAYCPFENDCNNCNKKDLYTLTDGGARKFTLRRYNLNGCRFELYNCADLSSDKIRANSLTVNILGEIVQKTKGNTIRGVN